MNKRLLSIFCEVLKLPSDIAGDNLCRDSIASWDSLTHIALVTAIENEFRITFSADEYGSIISYGTCAALLAAKGLE